MQTFNSAKYGGTSIGVVRAQNQNYFCAKDKLLSQYAMRSERLYHRIAWYCDESVALCLFPSK